MQKLVRRGSDAGLQSWSKWLRFAAANMMRNKRRSLATLSITTLGTCAILVAAGFALFTYRGLSETSARSTGHLIVAAPAAFDNEEDVPLQTGLENWEDLRRELLTDERVRHVLPKIEFTGLISNGDKTAIMLAIGIDPDAEFAVKGPFLRVRDGEVITGNNSNEVVIGEALARTLKAKVGAQLTLLATTTEGAFNAVDVVVRGIVSSGVTELDRRLVYADLGTAQQLLVTNRVSKIGVFLDRMDGVEAAKQRFEQLPIVRQQGLQVQTWLKFSDVYRSVKSLYDIIFGSLGTVIALIVLVVVANAMAMAVVERTREIGALRAMGTFPSQLTKMFGLEALLIGCAGAVLGAMLALLVSGLLVMLNLQMPPPPGNTYGYPLLIDLSWGMMFIVIAMFPVLCAFASVIVTRRTLNQSIVDALTHI
jgi:putative ABC transport system permease protein